MSKISKNYMIQFKINIIWIFSIKQNLYLSEINLSYWAGISILELGRHIHSLFWTVVVILNDIVTIQRWIYWLRALIFKFTLLSHRHWIVVIQTIIVIITNNIPMRFLHESIPFRCNLRWIKQWTLIWKLFSFTVFI